MRYKETLIKWAIPAALSLALIGTGIWGATQAQRAQQLSHSQDNAYARGMYELTENMGNIELCLSKLMISGSPGVNVALLSETARRCDAVVSGLGGLPLAHTASADLTGLANLTGDFCRALLEQAARGDPLEYEQIEGLKQLHNNCAMVNAELVRFYDRPPDFALISNDDYFDWEIDDISTELYEMNQNGPQLPSLIYDGPFSEALAGRSAQGLPAGIATEEQAKMTAIELLGLENEGTIVSTGLCEGVISCYSFEGENNQGVKSYVQISRQGGKVIMMMDESRAGAAKMDTADCQKAAEAFLQQQGFGPMTLTWTQVYSDTAVFNYAASQDGTVLYPDLVKVKVRMDTGTVCAMDAQAYYMNHVKRQLARPKMSAADAEALVSSQLTLESRQLCVAPTDGGGEALAWEFRGTFAEDSYIVYLDAHTGDEIKVFKVINTETGALTV